MPNLSLFFTPRRSHSALRFALTFAVVFGLAAVSLFAQGDPVSRMADMVARIAEYCCYAIAIVLLIVAAIQAMAGERNGMMAIGGAIVFAVIGLNARDIASLLRF